MKKMRALLSKNANYIYHMLSVSKCGYDNAYGEKYKHYHNKEDLQILKKYEKLITVRGGEHCGELHSTLVSVPSSFDEDIIQEYFMALYDLFTTENIELNYKQYRHIYEVAYSPLNITINIESHKAFYEHCLYSLNLKKEIAAISRVFVDHYSIYNEKIWHMSKIEINKAIEKLNNIFTENNYIEIWEKELNCKYKHDYFYAVICNSIENGPQAINISNTKDVFSLPQNYLATVNLINHEFGIYLLMDLLSETDAFNDFSYFNILESLAEYFNCKITGGSDFNWNRKYIDYYKLIRESNPSISIKEMFIKAKEKFVNR